MIEPLLIFLAGMLDRVRGDPYHFLDRRIFDKVAYGWVVAAIVGHPFDWLTVAIITLFGIGMSFGWGTPMGAYLGGHKTMDKNHLEWWQYGWAGESVQFALWVRGFLWALPLLLILNFGYINEVLAISVAVIFAFPLSIYLAKAMFRDKVWERTEEIRGWMIGSISFLLMEVLGG